MVLLLMLDAGVAIAVGIDAVLDVLDVGVDMIMLLLMLDASVAIDVSVGI